MHPNDQEKTSFMTKRGISCYKVMPFRLMNASAIYEWLVTKMSRKQIGKTMEVYINDMLVKSVKAEDHLEHLRQIFNIIERYIMRLNPNKSTFGDAIGLFLVYVIPKRRIEANLSQNKALVDMLSPHTKKEVMKLNGRAVALSYIISRSSNRCHKFFNILKRCKDFQ